MVERKCEGAAKIGYGRSVGVSINHLPITLPVLRPINLATFLQIGSGIV